VIYRDLNASRVPYMDNDWIGGVYAPAEVERTPEMQKALALSAELIAELQAADALLISSQCLGAGWKTAKVGAPSVRLRAQSKAATGLKASPSQLQGACAQIALYRVLKP